MFWVICVSSLDKIRLWVTGEIWNETNGKNINGWQNLNPGHVKKEKIKIWVQVQIQSKGWHVTCIPRPQQGRMRSTMLCSTRECWYKHYTDYDFCDPGIATKMTRKIPSTKFELQTSRKWVDVNYRLIKLMLISLVLVSAKWSIRFLEK